MATIVHWRRTVALITATAAVTTTAATMATSATAATASPPYPCAATGGPNADASAIGWVGNGQGATACLGGSFYVPNGINTTYGFGAYHYSPTTWTNADGYLPALVTTYGRRRHGVHHELRRPGSARRPPVRADLQPRRGAQPHRHTVTVDPQPTPGLVPLNATADQVNPGRQPTTTTWPPKTGSVAPTPGRPLPG